MKSIKQQLELHEGFRSKPYDDTTGHTTIGIGRNLDEKGITKPEAYDMLENDIKEIEQKLSKHDWFKELGRVRRKVIIDMCFNLGYNGLLEFENMIQALKDKQWDAAANQMERSRWYKQVKTRAERLVKMMRTGEDYDCQ